MKQKYLCGTDIRAARELSRLLGDELLVDLLRLLITVIVQVLLQGVGRGGEGRGGEGRGGGRRSR